jgi:flagellin
VDTWTAAAAGGDQTAAVTALSTTTGATSFVAAQTTLAGQLNQASADSKFLDATISFNSSKIDSLNAGLGALIDADLSKESANLQALQIKQQLGTQALSLANQSPQSLLSLFK